MGPAPFFTHLGKYYIIYLLNEQESPSIKYCHNLKQMTLYCYSHNCCPKIGIVSTI